MFVLMSYVHVITEPGARSVLQPALMSSTVQNSRKHRVQRQLILHWGVIEAPTPATAVREWVEGVDDFKERVSSEKVSLLYTHSENLQHFSCQLFNNKKVNKDLNL